MTPKQFLKTCGVLFITLALLGLLHVLGPSADTSIFGSMLWFDVVEIWIYLVIGIGAVLSSFLLDFRVQKIVAISLGIFSIALGIYSIFRERLFALNLESPADTFLLFVIGIWALISSRAEEDQEI